MTVQNLIVKNIASGNGSTTQWPFTFACPVDHPEYIKVYIKGASGKATATTDFSVNMTNKYVTYPVTGSVLASGEKIIIARELPLHQILNLVNQGPFYAEDLEVTYDELVMMIQQLNEQLGRSLKVGVDIDSDSDIDVTIPVPTDNDVHSLVLDKNGFKLFSNPGDAADYAAAAQNAASVAETKATVATNAVASLPSNWQDIVNRVSDNTTPFTKANKAYTKPFYKTIWADVCWFENGNLRNELKPYSQITNNMQAAAKNGAKKFCLMVNMCYNNGTYYRPISNELLLQYRDYARSLGCTLGWIKVHENTPIATINANYSQWLTAYKNTVIEIANLFTTTDIDTFTVMNEKPEVYNADSMYSEIVSLISNMINRGFKSGVTGNDVVRDEILAVATYNYQNIYPQMSYNANVQPSDCYDVMLKNLLGTAAARNVFDNSKQLFLSEIGTRPYVEYMMFPAKYYAESYWHWTQQQFRIYFDNVFKIIQNNSNIVGFADFYAHEAEDMAFLESVYKFHLKGEYSNVIL